MYADSNVLLLSPHLEACAACASCFPQNQVLAVLNCILPCPRPKSIQPCAHFASTHHHTRGIPSTLEVPSLDARSEPSSSGSDQLRMARPGPGRSRWAECAAVCGRAARVGSRMIQIHRYPKDRIKNVLFVVWGKVCKRGEFRNSNRSIGIQPHDLREGKRGREVLEISARVTLHFSQTNGGMIFHIVSENFLNLAPPVHEEHP